ncbi:MAG: 30S ribosomal protein S12 methylthiotransferase RimO [Lachnospiraceae bacterium]|nr:30S ribosomal protein S12 methylthiotransferase RimO [Lachnospiraceae bacterium]
MKVCFVSLGCDKNLVDSEHMLYLLEQDGFTFTPEPEDADIVVLNSCCFIGDAMEESINTVISLGRLKTEGNLKLLVLAGCLGQRFTDEVLKDLPEVDAIIGTNAYDEIVSVIRKALMDHKRPGYQPVTVIRDFSSLPKLSGRRYSSVLPYTYLKIAEGCDKRCTYCVIPSIRGSYRSYPMEDLVAEAKKLAEDGIKELNLVAQEVTLYGTDLYGQKSLPILLRKLSEIPGIQWIRLLYCYPEEITDELITEIKENPKVCHYIDMPIQHASDEILRRMGRKTRSEVIKLTIEKLRSEIPDIAIRTTFICGFPGETESDHQLLLDFVKEMAFDRVGAFSYSREEGTKAAEMEDQIDDTLKDQRRDALMLLQQKLVFEKNSSLIHKNMPCIIEGKVEDGVYAARSYRDAPDVDGLVFIETNKELFSGDIVSVHITKEKEYDLIGELEDEFTE